MRTLLALLLAAPSAAAVKNPDTFVYAAITDPETFDPAWAYDTGSAGLITNVHEYLLAYNGSGATMRDLSPSLSEKVPTRANGLISADGLTYRFPIRKGVKFHDGSTLTPEDVRYSLLRIMLMDRAGGPSSQLLQPILGLETTRPGGRLIGDLYERADKAVTVDGGDVVIRLAKPFTPFPTVVANFGAVLPKAWCVRQGQWDGRARTWKAHNDPRAQDTLARRGAVGTGPYRLARYEPATKDLLLERFDGYWGGPAAIKNVLIKVVPDFNTRKLMLQAGDADSIYTEQMYSSQLAGLPGVEVIDGLSTLERSPMLFFSFQVQGAGNPHVGSGKLDGEGIPPDFFADKDVRYAFAHSLDREAYARDLTRGKGRATGSLYPAALRGGTPDVVRHPYDPAKAEAHFRKAWGGRAWEKGFRFTMLYNAGSAPAQSLCQMIKRNVERLNPRFRIDLRSLQWSTYVQEGQRGRAPLMIGNWIADFPDPHNFAFVLMHSAGFFPQQQRYKNPAADELIEKAVRVLDEDERAALYREVQEIYDRDLPHVQIAEAPRYRAQRTWVKGFLFNPVFPTGPTGSYYRRLSKAE